MAAPGTKILIIDYEPRAIKQLRDPLEGAGYETRIAKDGVAGIEAFKSESPDLVLLEAMLPKRHGFEVCQEIKRLDPGQRTPVVIVTSVYKGRKYRFQAIHHYGCDEYLEKPVAADKLLETVERLLIRAQAASEPSEAATPEPAAPGVVPPSDTGEADIIDHLDHILGDGKGTGG